MTDFTDAMENRVVSWSIGTATTQPTAPLNLALTSTTPTDATAGTELAGGGYARQAITFGSVSGGAVSNTVLVRFDNLTGDDIAGVEVWDSNGTPFRVLWKALVKTVDPGDAVEFAVGEIDFIVT